jgi:hypothetical protein
LICGTSLTSATLFDPMFSDHPGRHKVLVNHVAAPIYGVVHRGEVGGSVSVHVANNGSPPNTLFNFVTILPARHLQ